MRNFVIDAGLAVLSAALLVLSFPDFDLPYLAWISFVPLLLLIRRSGPLKALLYSLLTGFIFYSGLMSWLFRTSGVNYFNYALGMFFLSLYFGIFGLLAHYYQRNGSRWNVLILPALWVALEYLKAHVFFLSTSWGILGYTQYSVFPVVQFAAFAGVYGISFFIVAVNAVVAEAVIALLVPSRTVMPLQVSLQKNRRVFAGILAGFLVLLAFSTLSSSEEKNAATLKVALVQGNVYWDVKKYNEEASYREGVFQKYAALTRSVMGSKPDLILWPSSSVPGTIPYDSGRVKMLADLAREAETFLLVGSSGFDKFRPDQRKSRQLSNSAFLFSRQGQLLGRYDKMRLLPFDEYLPLRGYIKWPLWIAADMIDSLPGKDKTVFTMDKAKFAVLICWENMFPEQFREMAAKGVDFMVSMTNEGFTKVAAGHHQMLAVNVLRAVENHVAIARISSTGVSCVIDPTGRIITRVQDEGGRDVNVEGFAVGQVQLSSRRTLYHQFGDWFMILVAAFLVFVTVKDYLFVRSRGTGQQMNAG